MFVLVYIVVQFSFTVLCLYFVISLLYVVLMMRISSSFIKGYLT